MKKYLFILFAIMALFITSSCGDEDPWKDHVCTNFEWVEEEHVDCLTSGIYDYVCTECGKVADVEEKFKFHNFESEITKEVTCTEDGVTTYTCTDCGYQYTEPILCTGHMGITYRVDIEPENGSKGSHTKVCTACGEEFGTYDFTDNGYSYHGKLSVQGADLVDEHGEKFQLIGLSTHGLQWAYEFVTYESFEAIRNEFGINVFRLSLYTEEGGYCSDTVSDEWKEYLYQTVCNGIDYATQLDCYVVVDWHMLGASDEGDENPLYHLKEAQAFFDRISEQYADHDNILYEIMNEPSGDTTGADCLSYAVQVIPKIRAHSDGIILVGGVHWSGVESLAYWNTNRSSLDKYGNIMYTVHFYCGSGTFNNQIKKYYEKGLPIFVTEHGGMNDDGDGDVNETAIQQYWDMLDSCNISYIAWNISNTKGSASIMKHGSTEYTNFSDDNLKVWGVLYKDHCLTRFGLKRKKTS